MRAMCDHTAVMSRKEIVTMRRSIIGIILISESSFRLPPPPPPTSTPPIGHSANRAGRGRGFVSADPVSWLLLRDEGLTDQAATAERLTFWRFVTTRLST